MSDEQTTETPEEQAPEAAEVEQQPEGNVDELPDWAQRELRRARDEAAKFRTEKQSYAKAFDGYTDEGRDWVLTTLVPALVNDYEGTVKTLAQELGITKAEAEQIVEEATTATPQEPKYLTEADIERKFAEREAKRAEAEQHQVILKEVAELGYDAAVDAQGNPTNVDTQYLMLLAARQTNGDLAEAHKLIEAGRDAIYQAKLAELEAAAKGHHKPAKGGGTPTQQDKAWVGDMKATAKAARAFLDARS